MEEEKMDIAEKLIAKARELDAIILAGYEKIAESDAFTQRIESAVEDQVGDIEDQIKSSVEDALYSWDIAESDGVKDTLHDLVESEIDSQFRSDKFKSVLETAVTRTLKAADPTDWSGFVTPTALYKAVEDQLGYGVRIAVDSYFQSGEYKTELEPLVSKEVAQRMMISSQVIAEKLERFADRIQNLENGDVERFHALEDQIKKLPADVEALVEIRLAEQQRPMTPIDQSFGRVEKRIAQLDINQQRHERALADSRLEVMAKLEEIMGQFRLADIGPLGSIPDSTDWSDTYRGMDKSIDNTN